VLEEDLTKNNTKETQHQTSSSEFGCFKICLCFKTTHLLKYTLIAHVAYPSLQECTNRVHLAVLERMPL